METGLRIIITFCFILSLSSCIKPKSESPEPAELLYTSFFEIGQYYFIDNNEQLIYKGMMPSVYLSKCWSDEKKSINVNLDSVSFNSYALAVTYSVNYTICESDTIPQTASLPLTWKVVGSSEFPSFTEIINDSLPRVVSYQTLPDSISRSNCSITVTGANATDVEVMIVGATDNLCWVHYLPFNSSTVTVYPSSNIPVTDLASLIINVKRWHRVTIEGKQIEFKSLTSYRKTLKIKP